VSERSNAGRSEIRIILADDQLLMREGLKQLLAGKKGFTVVAEAADAREALNLAANFQPEVLLLNVRLPLLQGSEGLQHLNGQRRTGIIIYSLYPEDLPLARSLHCGAGGFLSVDSSSAEMIEAIRTAASGGRYVAASLQASARTVPE
jgi:DNA-binding NarL/FixJ family response regulator